MSAESKRTDGPVKIIPPERGECVGIHAMRQVVFLQGIQAAGMEHGRRVTRAHVNAGHARVIRIPVAIAAEQATSRGFLPLVALGLDPPADVVNLVVLEAEHVDHALAIDKDVIRATGGVLPIGADFVERAGEPPRDLALRELEAADLALRAHRLAPTSM